VVVSAVGGFFLARLPLFLNPVVLASAQNRTLEYVNQWAGVPIMQYPNDLVLYQEIIAEHEPDWIIETGTAMGGLTLYLSSVLQSLKPEAKILTVDIDRQYWDKTRESLKNPNVRKLLERIEFIEGSSTAPEVVAKMKERIGTKSKVMVILDSYHAKDHVLDEMKLYGEMVSPGSYLIVNDTQLDRFTGEAGPNAALAEFLPAHPEFTPDRSRERFMISCSFGGWLRKKQ